MKSVPFSDFVPNMVNLDFCTNWHGTDQALLSYGPEMEPVCLQTPWLCSLGLSVFEKQGERPSYTVNLALKGHKTNPHVKLFSEKMVQVNDLVLDAVTEHSCELFGCAMTRREVKKRFKPMVRYGKCGRPMMRVKIPSSRPPKISSVASPEKDVDMHYLVKDSGVLCLIKPVRVWFMNNEFGVTWELEAARVTPPKPLILAPNEQQRMDAALESLHDYWRRR